MEKINKETYVEIAKKIIKAYEQADFTELYPLFSEDILWCSQWVVPDRKGKEKIIKYYDEKARQIKNSNSKIKGLVIETIEQGTFEINPNVPLPQVILYTPAGRICAIIGQRVDDRENHMVLTFELNDKLQITNISIADPSFYTFKVYEEA